MTRFSRPVPARASGRLAVLLVAALLVLEVIAFTISTLPGVRPDSFSVPLDGWLQGGAYVTAAVLAALRPLLDPQDRRWWTWLAAALAFRAAAFVVYLGFVRTMDPQPYPSLADAGWLAMEACALVAIAGFATVYAGRLAPSIVLDGIVGACAVAGLGLALLYDTLVARTAPGIATDVVITNVAYPILDALLLVMLLALLAACEWRPPPSLWLLAIGLGGFAVVDCVFLYQVTAGSYRPGTPLAALSLIATSMIAAAAWAPATRPVSRYGHLPGLVLPAVFALICLGVLVYAAIEPEPASVVALSAVGLLAATARTGLSFREVRHVAEARREARTDELTGLANRRHFNEELTRALADRPRDRRLGLLLIDLDNFKEVNDGLGHHRGDALLAELAPRMQLLLRDGDLLARIGGDEFAVLLDGADAGRASQIAERLRFGLARAVRIAGRDVTVSGSVGIAVFPQDGLEATELFQHADAAMYDAKATRSGQEVHRPERHIAGSRRAQEAERLRQALDEEAFALHYQPQVSLFDGTVVAAEALVRWEHPAEGLLLPVSFLPQIEASGLMRRLTASVLEQAVRQAAAWRDAGTPIPVAVNLSVTNLLDAEFPAAVALVLDGVGLPGDLLKLELTEDLLMADPGRGVQVIAALRELGVGIHVDDYGTGYSSLSYLRDLHELRGLKLDRSFVGRLEADERTQAIVAATIALARSLGLELVAEGVETTAARDRLAQLGCEYAQGYLFARPSPGELMPLGTIESARAAIPPL
ncbi:MAG: EAL domain-containing protein [Solirubrobacteraceae bacterium]